MPSRYSIADLTPASVSALVTYDAGLDFASVLGFPTPVPPYLRPFNPERSWILVGEVSPRVSQHLLADWLDGRRGQLKDLQRYFVSTGDSAVWDPQVHAPVDNLAEELRALPDATPVELAFGREPHRYLLKAFAHDNPYNYLLGVVEQAEERLGIAIDDEAVIQWSRVQVQRLSCSCSSFLESVP